MSGQTIARAARAAGVNVETLRYYERVGLIERPKTVGTAYRSYPDETIERVRFIKRAQGLGLMLREIRDLLVLRADPDASCGAVKRKIAAKVADIEGRLADLSHKRDTLLDLLDSCSGRGSSKRCPILRSLDDPPQATKRKRRRS